MRPLHICRGEHGARQSQGGQLTVDKGRGDGRLAHGRLRAGRVSVARHGRDGRRQTAGVEQRATRGEKLAASEDKSRAALPQAGKDAQARPAINAPPSHGPCISSILRLAPAQERSLSPSPPPARPAARDTRLSSTRTLHHRLFLFLAGPVCLPSVHDVIGAPWPLPVNVALTAR